MTALALTGRAHGTNSQFSPPKSNSELTVSKVELKQNGSTVGSNELPVLHENYAEQRPYSVDSNWTDISVAIPGTLVAGQQATVTITAGTDSGYDDFELKNVKLMNCEEGQPVVPRLPRPLSNDPPRQAVGTTSPAAGLIIDGTARPARPALAYLLRDGKATPTAPATAASGLTVPKGSTTLVVSVFETGAKAVSGSRGAGWSEFFQIVLRGATVTSTLYGQLKSANGSPAAGDGTRSCSWDITSLVSGESREIVAGSSRIVSEAGTITVAAWTVRAT